MMARWMAPPARTVRSPAYGAARDRRRTVGPPRALLVASALLLCLDQRPLGAQGADVDRDHVLPILNRVLETERTDVEVPWSNPETGNSGTIVVERTFYLEPGKPCREYRRTVERAGSPAVVIEGTGCRTGPGHWNLDEEEPPPTGAERPGAASPGGAVATAPDPDAPPGCPPVEPAAGPAAPEPPTFAEFTMPAKAKL
jgi:surface antigen